MAQGPSRRLDPPRLLSVWPYLPDFLYQRLADPPALWPLLLCTVPRAHPLGRALDSAIQTGKPLRLEHDLHLAIFCIRTEQRGKHSYRTILWQDEEYYSASAKFLETEPGHTAIPVRFQLPAGQPECQLGGRVSISWRLEARSQMRGPAFHECFGLPVFNTPAFLAPTTVDDAAIPASDDAAAPATGNDVAAPAAGLLAGVEEIRRDQHSRIRVGASMLGHEFYFPPARNVVSALITTVAALVFDGVTAFLIAKSGGPWSHRDAIFFDVIFLIGGIIMKLGFGLISLMITCFAFSAWFKSTRVNVDSAGVQAHDHWLFFFQRSRHIAESDIDHFEIESRGSTTTPSGNQTYWDVQICTRAAVESGLAAQGLGAIILAKSVAKKEEAQWLADQMACALGRQPFPARA